MTVAQADSELEFWSRDYWLGHCEGFRVEDGARRLGFVEEILGGEDDPVELVVRGGRLANRVYRIRVEEILRLEPRAERILVRADREPAR